MVERSKLQRLGLDFGPKSTFENQNVLKAFLIVFSVECQKYHLPVLFLTSSVEMVLRVTDLPVWSQKYGEEFVTVARFRFCHVDPDIHFCV